MKLIKLLQIEILTGEIKQNCKKFYIYHSDNDPYVPMKKATELAKKLDSKIIEIKNAGHFNEKAGYKNNKAPTLNHFYEKLLLLKNRMNTSTGKLMAEHRHIFMEQYLDKFYEEWNREA